MEPKLISNLNLSDGVIREEQTGKLTLIGTFHYLRPPAFPFHSPPFWITVALANYSGRLNGRKISLEVGEKSSDQPLFKAGAEIGSTTDVSPDEVVQIPFRVEPVFPSPGLYTINVSADGSYLGSRDFTVRPVEARP